MRSFRESSDCTGVFSWHKCENKFTASPSITYPSFHTPTLCFDNSSALKSTQRSILSHTMKGSLQLQKMDFNQYLQKLLTKQVVSHHPLMVSPTQTQGHFLKIIAGVRQVSFRDDLHVKTGLLCLS